MKTSALLWETLKRGRLIALLSPVSPEECVSAYETLTPLGVVLEIALRTEFALPGITALRTRHPDALFMAGTVITPRQAELAMEAGAAGIVSPDFFPEVVEACMQRDVLCLPGGIGDAGKQLALKARLLRCDIDELQERYPYQWAYKLFPAMAAAPTFLEMAAGWRAVYPGMTVVYAGGVTAENLHQIVNSDPEGIVCGSALGRYAKEPEALAREARRWLDVIHGVGHRAAAGAAVRPAEAPDVHRPGRTVVTFGELMLRLSAPPGLRFNQAAGLDATFGGAEANVAVALANWGFRTRVVTALPAHGHRSSGDRRFAGAGRGNSPRPLPRRPDRPVLSGAWSFATAVAGGLRSRGIIVHHDSSGADRLG